MRRFAVLLALLVVALATRAARREATWEPTRIGEHWVLEGDVHVHSSWVGALATPVDLPLLARRTQLDFIAVTEHNAWFGGAMTRALGRTLAPEVIVLPSEEVTNRAYHLLAVGLARRVDPQQSLSAIAADVHTQGGVVLAAHPTRETWPLLLGLAAAHGLDGAELYHPTMLHHPEVAAEYATFLDEASERSGRRLLAAGSSDFHGGAQLGLARTLVLAKERSAAGVLEALHAGRAVAVTADGRSAGDPGSLAALAHAGYVTRAGTVAAPGPTTALERVLAWLALAVMVAALLRPRRSRR